MGIEAAEWLKRGRDGECKPPKRGLLGILPANIPLNKELQFIKYINISVVCTRSPMICI